MRNTERAPSKGRLSQLQKLILAQLYRLGGPSGARVRHWDLLLAVAQRYKFTRPVVEKFPPTWGTRAATYYGKVEISEGRTGKNRQYIDQAFQVSFSRSLDTLEKKGLIFVLGIRKATGVCLHKEGAELGAKLIVKMLAPRVERLIAKMPVAVPRAKRVSVARLIKREFERLRMEQATGKGSP